MATDGLAARPFPPLKCLLGYLFICLVATNRCLFIYCWNLLRFAGRIATFTQIGSICFIGGDKSGEGNFVCVCDCFSPCDLNGSDQAESMTRWRLSLPGLATRNALRPSKWLKWVPKMFTFNAGYFSESSRLESIALGVKMTFFFPLPVSTS